MYSFSMFRNVLIFSHGIQNIAFENATNKGNSQLKNVTEECVKTRIHWKLLLLREFLPHVFIDARKFCD